VTIPARRRHGGAPIVLIACGVLALVPAVAAGKPRRADLTVAAVTLSAAPAAGATVKARVTVRNTQKVSAPRSQLSVSLETLRAPLARAAVGKLKPGGKLTLSVALKFPRSLALGRYRITVCADAAKKVKERSETNNCRKLSQVLEVVAPAVLPAPRLPAPAPVATPAAGT
jgi:hypothetical protein